MKASKLWLAAALVVGVMLAYSPSLRAQDNNANSTGKTHPARGAAMQQRLDKMAENLKLTADQKTKVEAVLKDQVKKMRGMRDLPKDERREKAKALHEETTKKMKEILTADQFTQWEKERRQGRGPRKQGGDTK